jgi:hypothetical protein
MNKFTFSGHAFLAFIFSPAGCLFSLVCSGSEFLMFFLSRAPLRRLPADV